MSAKEIDRADTVRRVLEKRLTQAKAASLMGISVRQVKRLCRGYKGQGIEGLVSRQRGRPRKLSDDVQAYAVQLVRQRYGDFGPKLAHEKLVELHGVRVGRETLRKWLIEAGVWITRVERAPRAHQPRNRRIVDRVHDSGGDEHGGHFVRVSHFGGMVFTQYFHLAAVPRRVARGAHVKAGDVIGLLGDTGIKGARRHLHFALSVLPSVGFSEVYWDPTPLMADWPLRVPTHCTVAGLASIHKEGKTPSRRRSR